VRIPETLMCAMEFITLYTPPEHSAPLEELRKVVAPFYGDLMARSNKTFWQRKVGPAAPHSFILNFIVPTTTLCIQRATCGKACPCCASQHLLGWHM
jgi:hypothetical protein